MMKSADVEALLANAREAAKTLDEKPMLPDAIEAYEKLRRSFTRLDELLKLGTKLPKDWDWDRPAPVPPSSIQTTPDEQLVEVRARLLSEITTALRRRVSEPSALDCWTGIVDPGVDSSRAIVVELLEATQLLTAPSSISSEATLVGDTIVKIRGSISTIGIEEGRIYNGSGSYSTRDVCRIEIDLRDGINEACSSEDSIVVLYVSENNCKKLQVGKRVEIRLIAGS